METKEIEEFFVKYRELLDEYEEVSKKKTELYKKLDQLERNMVEHFKSQGKKDSYKSNVGTMGWREEITYKLSHDEDIRNHFFEYLKDKGVYDSMRTIHSQTLNAFCKREREAYGEDFEIPGIELGEPRLIVTFRRN